MKEIKGDLNKRRSMTRPWIERYNIVNMSVLPKFIYRFSIIPIKSQQAFGADIDELTLKFIGKGKGVVRRGQRLATK